MTYEDVHQQFMNLLSGPLNEANREYFERQAKTGYGILNDGKWISERGYWQCRTYLLHDQKITRDRGCAFAIVPKFDAPSQNVFWLIAKNADGSPCWDYSCPMDMIKAHISIEDLKVMLHNAKRMMGEKM